MPLSGRVCGGTKTGEELERRGLPYEFYSYEGLQHYFSTIADTPQTDDAADVSGFAKLPAKRVKCTSALTKGYVPSASAALA